MHGDVFRCLPGGKKYSSGLGDAFPITGTIQALETRTTNRSFKTEEDGSTSHTNTHFLTSKFIFFTRVYYFFLKDVSSSYICSSLFYKYMLASIKSSVGILPLIDVSSFTTSYMNTSNTIH